MDVFKHCTDLEDICRDRPLTTPEIHGVNSFYGHAEILKAFLGLPETYPLKAMIMHAPGVEHHIWEAEEQSPLPFFLCASEKYAAYFNKNNTTKKVAIAIGPILSYMAGSVPVPPPGDKTMVFFPVHSTHYIHAQVDASQTLRAIDPVRKKYDRWLLCIYWKDYLLGRHRPYEREGFHCVSAGHMFDPLFLYRLRAVLLASDLVVSGRPGTEVLYAALLGRPVWIRVEHWKTRYTDSNIKEKHQDILKAFNPGRLMLPKLFAQPATSLDDRQLDFVRDLCGAGQVKTRERLREILLAAELRYSLANGRIPDPRLVDEV